MSSLALVSLLTAFFCVLLGSLIFYLEPASAKNRLFLAMALFVGFWAFTEFGARQADSFSEAFFWLKLSALSLIVIAIAAHFTLNLTGRQKWFGNANLFWFIYFPAIILIALDMGSNIFTGLPAQKPWGWSSDSSLVSSPLGHWQIYLAFLAGILIVFLLWQHYTKVPNLLQKQQVLYIIAGFSIPVILGYGTEIAFHFARTRPPEIIVLTFAAGIALVGYSIWREKHFHLTAANLADDIIENIDGALILVNSEGIIRLVNPAALRLLGYQKPELLNQSVDLILEKSDVLNLFKTLNKKNPRYTVFLTKNGAKIHVALFVSQIWQQQQMQGVIIIGRDLTSQKEVEQKLILRLEQEKLLHKASANLIHLSKFEDFLQQTLKLLGQHLGVSRISIYEYHPEQEHFRNHFIWQTEDTPELDEQLRKLPSILIPNTMAKLQQNEMAIYEDIPQIPDGPGKDLIVQHNFRAFLFVPLFVNNQFFGFIAFSKRFEKRKWQTEELNTIRSVSYIITGAIERNSANQALQNAYLNLEKKVEERTVELTDANRRLKEEIAEKMEAQKTNESLLGSLTFLSRTAIGFVELPHQSNIYEYTAQKLRELLGEVGVIITSFDEKEQCVILQAQAGLNIQLHAVEQALHRSLLGACFQSNPNLLPQIQQGKIFTTGYQISALLPNAFSEQDLAAIEQTLQAQEIYLMGLSRQETILGVAVIILFPGQTLQNREIAETFLNQASIALQRHKAENILRSSEEKYRNLAENLEIGIILINPEMTIMAANRKVRNFFPQINFDANPLYSDIFPEEKKAKSGFLNPAAQVFLKGTPCINIQKTFLGNDPSYLKLTAVPLKNSDQQVVAATVMIQDITMEFAAEEKIKQYQEQLRAMTMELSVIEDKERRKIATQLHDYIGQNLAFAKIKLGELKESGLTMSIKQPLNEVYHLLEEAIASSRSLTFELSPPILYELGLESAFEWLAENLKKQHGLNVTISNSSPEPIAIKDDDILILTFKSVRELLANVIKHSQVKNADLSIQKDSGQLILTVSDQGVGFDPEKIYSGNKKLSGFGLFNLKENLYYLGGEMKIESRPNQGSKITLVIPLAKSKGGSREY